MKTTRSLKIIALCALLAGCYDYKDRGNYDYLSAVKVSFMYDNSDIAGFLTMTFGTPFSSHLRVHFSDPTLADRVDYFWLFGADTIWRELNLRDYIFPPLSSGGQLTVTAVDRLSGYTSYAQFLAYSPTSQTEFPRRGWVILAADADDNSRLHYIDRWSEGYRIIPDIYRRFNPSAPPLGRHPIHLDYSLGSTRGALLVLQKEGSREFDARNLLRDTVALEQRFLERAFPPGFVPKDVVYCQYYADALLGEDGKVYGRTNAGIGTTASTSLFFPRALRYQGNEVDIEKLIDHHYMTLMYDKKKARLLAISKAPEGLGVVTAVTDTITTNFPGDAVRLNNLQDYELRYAHGRSPRSWNLLSVLKSPTKGWKVQNSLLLSDQTAGQWTRVQGTTVIDFPHTDHFTDNSVFMKCSTKPYLFFSQGSKLFYFDITRPRQPLQLFHDFGFYRVTALEHNPSESVLAVGLDNGDVYLLGMDDNQLLAPTVIYQASGLGRIVDIAYRFGSNGPWENAQD
jgi:hypothetical protein